MVTPSALYVQGAQVQRLLQTRSTEATPSDPHCRGTCGYRLSRLLLLWLLLLLSDPILLLLVHVHPAVVQPGAQPAAALWHAHAPMGCVHAAPLTRHAVPRTVHGACSMKQHSMHHTIPSMLPTTHAHSCMHMPHLAALPASLTLILRP